ncbi:MAG: Holliday junction resolvase RuvX [Oscillospiraceae bacterium]|nr:Holliday junction resolvase RuvX [Oscillospiraceae bacterium]
MVILAVDYGDVRTGVAVCDKNEILASPVCVISERSPETLAKKIADLCAQYKAESIVLGLPKNMDGSEGFRADAVKSFAEILKAETSLPIVLRDERLTTVSAHQFLNITNTRGKKRKNTVDAVSAVLILEDYIGFRHRDNKT